MIRQAKRTADSEREEKAILCQWLNGYVVWYQPLFVDIDTSSGIQGGAFTRRRALPHQ